MSVVDDMREASHEARLPGMAETPAVRAARAYLAGER